MFYFVCGPLVYIRFGVSCHCIIQAVDQACSPSSKKGMLEICHESVCHHKDWVSGPGFARESLALISSVPVSDSIPFATPTKYGAN